MDNPGAGNYDVDRADALTKPKVPNVDMGKSPSRPTSFAKPGSDAAGGPGEYDVDKKFGDGGIVYTHGVKRPVPNPLMDNPAPGNYNTDRAEALTKPNVPKVDMGKSPSRPSSFANPGAESGAAPGQYDTGAKCGDDAKPITIGGIGRPDETKHRADSPGPGMYNE